MTPPKDIREKMRDTLFAGRYSLFFGAGASFGSKNSLGAALPMTEEFRQDLVKLKSLKEKSSLQRAYSQLTQGEIDTHLTDRFSNCVPGSALLKIPNFVWRRIYTLNIDDALENAYQANPGHQSPISITHKTPYVEATDINSTQIVHIHGWARKPEDGYVFSLAEYASTMGPNSPWSTVLAHTLATEPFIIAGTSLEEPDLEYFLSGRQTDSVRKDRGPSFLVEPTPDAATEKECERHGLILYRGTLLEFMTELEQYFPSRPLPANATTSLSRNAFSVSPSAKELALFARDFGYVVAQQVQENADLSFFVGRKPTVVDIALNRDISRSSTLPLKTNLRRRIGAGNWDANFLLVHDNAGTGKTTIMERAIYDLAGEGIHIFEYKSLSSPNIDVCSKIFNAFSKPFVIACDNFADHVNAIVELYRRVDREDFLIVGFERSYRMDYVFQAIAGNAGDEIALASFNETEAKELIVKMEGHGLTSFRVDELVRQAIEMAKDPIAIAVCRIMNDFRPIEDVVYSILHDADDDRLQRYVGSALAAYCYRGGIAYSILSAAFGARGFDSQFRGRDMLPLSFSDADTREYVVPTNPLLGERILRRVSKETQGLMFETYCAIGAQVGSYVNRGAIMKRTPEARLAGRLFDYDDVVQEFIPDQSEAFFLRMKKFWDWNSRYWEQFALLKLDQFLKSTKDTRFDFLTQAISHAKHAIRLERHPLGLTTLGRILHEDMKHGPARFRSSFEEAFEYLDEAIKTEGAMNRIAIHPYTTLFSGTMSFINQMGILTGAQVSVLQSHLDNAERLFSFDRGLMVLASDLRRRLPSPGA
jgi:SIR2-like domain